MILKKGSLGSKFYFVLNGVVKIYSEQSDNSFERYFTSGMYFGETALLDSHEKRMAEYYYYYILLQCHGNHLS